MGAAAWVGGRGPLTRLWVKGACWGPGPPRTAAASGEKEALCLCRPHLTYFLDPVTFLNCQSKYESEFAETIPRQEGTGQGGGSRGEDSLLGNVQRGSATHQLQFLVGVQGGAFALRPFLHPLQDVLGTGRVRTWFHRGRPFLRSPPPRTVASPLVPAASHGWDTPHEERRRGRENLPPTRGPSIAHKPCLALR